MCGKGNGRCRDNVGRGMEDVGTVWEGEWKMQGQHGKGNGRCRDSVEKGDKKMQGM